MKNMSIRTKILGGVVIVNLLGALATMVYLHQSFSGGLAVHAGDQTKIEAAAWQDMTSNAGKPVNAAFLVSDGAKLVERMKAITGADFSLLLSKDAVDEQAWTKAREAAGQPNNWDERDAYALAGATDEALAEKMQINAAPDSVPEMGKTVGIENGACAKTCHGSLKAEGDFWGVAWRDDGRSLSHTVVPVSDSTGNPIGILYSVENISGIADADKSSLVKTGAVILVTLLAATLFIGFLLDTLVLKRLKRMIAAMEDMTMRVAGGDFDAHFEPDGTTDEIGEFEDMFARFVDLVVNSLKSFMQKSA